MPIIWYVFMSFVEVAKNSWKCTLIVFFFGTCVSIRREAPTTIDECVLDLGEAEQKVAKVSG